MGFPTLMNRLFITIYHTRVLLNREMQVEMQRHQWAWVGQADVFKFKKNKGACHQSCQWLSILTANRDGEVTKHKNVGNFLIYFVCLIETWTGETFSTRTTVKCLWRHTFRIWAKNLHMHMVLVVVVTIHDLLCKRAASSNNLLCSFDHLSVIKINPNNWVRWLWTTIQS